jgi:hypothetical protein
MRVPPPFAPAGLQTPRMAETQPGSIFSPAIAAWSSPEQLRLGALGFSNWMTYALVGGLLWLAYRRKIPWWLGVGGAGAAWWLLGAGGMTQTITNGQGIVSNGTQLALTVNSPGTLVTMPTGVSTLTVAGTAYPVRSTTNNADGSQTFYLDNPTPLAT